jgi:hypothetical protein
MKPEDVKVGARVRYIDQSNQPHFFGVVGTIKKIVGDPKCYCTFDVYQDDGSPLGDFGPSWATLAYFELVENSSAEHGSQSRKECPCGIYRGDCDYHK